jgi:hypothetical protein
MNIPFHSLDLMMVAVMACLWIAFEFVHHEELRHEAVVAVTGAATAKHKARTATIQDR